MWLYLGNVFYIKREGTQRDLYLELYIWFIEQWTQISGATKSYPQVFITIVIAIILNACATPTSFSFT